MMILRDKCVCEREGGKQEEKKVVGFIKKRKKLEYNVGKREGEVLPFIQFLGGWK